ncbi:hypothetical protein L6164_036368 [Bauhinia variegata]|uniref:Uncharacterized protein n=1 Tax=Bauhinia variegata TaxID=167791 RepID=A0ACB9KGT9_BAUVA|nr:hypothetical protein L6164_036368 [Bauhinia variegata]
MSRPGSYRVSKKFRSFLELLYVSRIQSRNGGLPREINPSLAASRLGTGYWMHPGLQFFSTYGNTSSSDSNIVKNVKVQAAPPSSAGFSFSNWLRWVLGSVVSLLLPLWT